MASFIKTSTHVSIVFDNGEPATVYSSNPNFEAVIKAIKNNDWTTAYNLAFPVEQVRKQFAAVSDRVKVDGGIVTLDGTPIHGTLADRILEMHRDGFDIAPMSKFLENLMENPSYRAVNELYGFLESSKLPITEDGHFLAYKRVDENFYDLYTHKMDNSPGKVVEMPRNQVNEDKNQTCSAGLHFCARSYLPHYGGSGNSRVVMVKINPADVVSIPTDYNNAKGRCCRYEVLRELTINNEAPQPGRVPDENIEGAYHDTGSSGDPEDFGGSDFGEFDNGLDEFDSIDEDCKDIEEDMDDLYPIVDWSGRHDTWHGSSPQPEQDLTSSIPEMEELSEGGELEIVGVEQLAFVEDGSISVSPSDGEQVIASFLNVRHAMDATGIDSSSITKVCNGERQSAGGYKWRWKMEEDAVEYSEDEMTEEDLDILASVLKEVIEEFGIGDGMPYDTDDLIRIFRNLN